MDAAADLLREANDSNIVGYVGVYLLPGQEYVLVIAGECKNVPALMRGLLNGLDDKLANLVRGSDHDA